MKKAELHCHIDQLLDPAILSNLKKDGIDLGVSDEELQSILPITSLEGWNRYNHLLDKPSIKEHTFEILGHHVMRLIAQEVTYSEIMVSGLLFSRPNIEDVIQLFKRGKSHVDQIADGKIQVEFLVAVARGPLEKLERQMERIIELFKSGVIRGLAIAGDDRKFPLKPILPAVEKAKAVGMGIEIHTGELSGPQDVRDALDSGLPDRLGHAVSAFKDEALIDKITRQAIHVEFCPTSNLVTGAVTKIEGHPIRIANDRKMNFSVNTDDPGPFGCSMDSEYDLLRRELGFQDSDFSRIYENSVKAGFGKVKV